MPKNLKEILGFITDPSRLSNSEIETVNTTVLNEGINLLGTLFEKHQVNLEDSLVEFLGDELQTHSPSSRRVKHFEYNSQSQELLVTFGSDKTYLYCNVEVDLWVNLLLTDQYGTVGTYFGDEFIGNPRYFCEEDN